MSAIIHFLLEENLTPEDQKLQRCLKIMAASPVDETQIIGRIKNSDLKRLYKEENLKKIKHLNLIDKLDIDKEKALIIASSVLVMCDVIEKNDDLDLCVTKQVFNKAAKSLETVKTYKREYNKVFYQTPKQELEMAVNFQILEATTEKLLKRAVNIEGYNFMSLRDTYRMYRILNRSKDVEKLRKLKKIFADKQ